MNTTANGGVGGATFSGQGAENRGGHGLYADNSCVAVYDVDLSGGKGGFGGGGGRPFGDGGIGGIGGGGGSGGYDVGNASQVILIDDAGQTICNAKGKAFTLVG